jgi:hypothetical protein
MARKSVFVATKLKDPRCWKSLFFRARAQIKESDAPSIKSGPLMASKFTL